MKNIVGKIFDKNICRYFTEHVIKGKCPYSQQSQEDNLLLNRQLVCDMCEVREYNGYKNIWYRLKNIWHRLKNICFWCQEVVAEDELEQHIETKHLTQACPACKSRHEDR